MNNITPQQKTVTSLLTREGLARRWQCCTRTIIRYEAQGVITSVRLGPKMVRFRMTDIEAIEAQWAAQG